MKKNILILIENDDWQEDQPDFIKERYKFSYNIWGEYCIKNNIELTKAYWNWFGKKISKDIGNMEEKVNGQKSMKFLFQMLFTINVLMKFLEKKMTDLLIFLRLKEKLAQCVNF